MTIRDVAARAGVSPATVSRVFSRPDAVTPETRQRVMAAADALRYAPNPVARSLARGRTGNIGLLVPDIANAFFAPMIKSVQQEARRNGLALFVADSDEQVRDEDPLTRAMAKQVDGLILAAPRLSDDGLRELAEFTSLVLISRQLDPIPAVVTPAVDGISQAVEHLHALGHREILYLSGPDTFSNRLRRRGLTEACHRLGVPFAEVGPFEPRYRAGVRAADLVVAREATAVIAYNDEIAIGAMIRLAERGRRVGVDVSVVGVDDTSVAEVVTPRLTTVRVPAAAAGAAAVTLLLDVIAGRDLTTRRTVELPTELIVRASTGPAPHVV